MPTRFATHLAYLTARALILGDALPTGSGLYVALSRTVIADSDQHVLHVNNMTTFTEYNGTYARQLLTSVVISEDTVTHKWKLRAANPDFGTPGTPSAPAVALLLYLGTSANAANDNVAYPVAWWQGTAVPALPFTGDGATSLVIPFPSSGILFGPNP